MIIRSWSDVLISSLQHLWVQVVSFLPNLLGALIVFVVGLVIASGLASLMERLVEFLRVDKLLRQVGLEAIFERAGLKLNAGRFFGAVVYWFLVVAFLLAASDILQFFALSSFLNNVLLYIPNIIIAALIMLVAFVAGNFLRGLVRASVKGTGVRSSKFLGSLVWWAIVVFGLLSALTQLGIATSIINTVITGLIAMVALAGGIAFGLGGKDYAAHLLGRLRESTEER